MRHPRRRRRTCRRKTRYKTADDARAAAGSLRRRTGAIVAAYRCPIRSQGKPRHWHIGHIITRGRRLGKVL